MNITTINSIHEVDKKSWNELRGGPYYSHEWFSYVEECFSEELKPTYLVCKEKEELVGGLPTFRPLVGENAYYNAVFGNNKWLNKIPFLKSKPLLCFSPYAYTSDILTKNKKREETIKKLLVEAQKLMEKEELTEIVFFNLSDKDKYVTKQLEQLGYLKMFHFATTILKNKWKSFDEYVMSLKKRYRKTVRSDIKKFEESGAKIKILTDYKEALPKITKLSQNILDHHKSNVYRNREEIIASLYKHLKPYLEILVCEQDGEYIATVAHLEKDGIVGNQVLGLDYEKTKKNRTYYNIVYYEWVRKIIKKGIPEVYLGTEAYRTKEMRGCTFADKYLYIKQRKKNPMKNLWFVLLNKYYRRKFKKHYKKGW
jgi:predicted N-acyltransferase